LPLLPCSLAFMPDSFHCLLRLARYLRLTP
jgi:hypothetical protein